MIHGVLVMLGIDTAIKEEIYKTVEIIQLACKDKKEKYLFNDFVIFTRSIPTLTDVVA